MEIKWIRQPTRTSCGQTAVAMALGVPVEKVIETVGHATYTKSEDRARAAQKLGGSVGPRVLFTGMENLPPMALLIVALRRRDSRSPTGFGRGIRRAGHCVLWADGKFYDPTHGPSNELKVPGGIIIGFNEIKRG